MHQKQEDKQQLDIVHRDYAKAFDKVFIGTNGKSYGEEESLFVTTA